MKKRLHVKVLTGDALELDPLPYPETALSPTISSTTVRAHHDILQAGYVDKAQKALKRLEELRRMSAGPDRAKARVGAVMSLVSNASGATLHDLYWKNMAPKSTTVPPELGRQVAADFGSMDSFITEMKEVASALSGSGWVVLAWVPSLDQTALLPVGKHDRFIIPGSVPLLVLDLWEHAYYFDVGPNKMRYVDGFFRHVNWIEVARRLRHARR